MATSVENLSSEETDDNEKVGLTPQNYCFDEMIQSS